MTDERWAQIWIILAALVIVVGGLYEVHVNGVVDPFEMPQVTR